MQNMDNNVAHVLARFALILIDELVWMKNVPAITTQVVLDDISNE